MNEDHYNSNALHVFLGSTRKMTTSLHLQSTFSLFLLYKILVYFNICRQHVVSIFPFLVTINLSSTIMIVIVHSRKYRSSMHAWENIFFVLFVLSLTIVCVERSRWSFHHLICVCKNQRVFLFSMWRCTHESVRYRYTWVERQRYFAYSFLFTLYFACENNDVKKIFVYSAEQSDS